MRITKKIVFWISLVGVAVFFIAGYAIPLLCGVYSYICQDRLETFFPFLLLFFPIFLFSLITYFLREEVFRAWLRFTYWWLPLSFVMIYLAAGSSGGSFGIPNVLDQETVAFIFSALFALISLILIAIKSLLLYRK